VGAAGRSTGSSGGRVAKSQPKAKNGCPSKRLMFWQIRADSLAFDSEPSAKQGGSLLFVSGGFSVHSGAGNAGPSAKNLGAGHGVGRLPKNKRQRKNASCWLSEW